MGIGVPRVLPQCACLDAFQGVSRHPTLFGHQNGPRCKLRVLERRIEEGKGDIIKIKRARNSLLNIPMRIPPEILGYNLHLEHRPEANSRAVLRITLRRVTKGILQPPPRLPPLVRGRISHSARPAAGWVRKFSGHSCRSPPGCTQGSRHAR